MTDTDQNPSAQNPNAGSYAFGGFRQNQQELDRLKAQADAAQALEQAILQQCGLRPGMRVLDLACGPGLISCLLARMVAGGQVLGLDLSPQLLDEARAHAAQAGLANLSFQQGDAYALELADGGVDFVYARFLFQHLKRPEQALSEIMRVLRPGGILAIADVDDAWLSLYPEPARFAAFVRRAAQAQAGQGGDRHIGRKLAGLLAEAGFAQVNAWVQGLSSSQLGMQALLDLTTGFKLQQLVAEDPIQAEADRADIYRLLQRPNAWGCVGVFLACGLRPVPDPD
ncbi:MAG: methyltransferase domain-containing protein [Gammaproteobacteria bacterium SHHR-1]|uniref:class I SAM-dependent methyltransferase n=1 Tax=Magnetovirga frankeli TaxID=947516 RepID=UPI001293632D|nr:methyltransferase domain-containing protein [gamma proteobacterium SS-5]